MDEAPGFGTEVENGRVLPEAGRLFPFAVDQF